MTDKKFEYTALTEAEKLTQARDALHARETDHYRLTILADTEPTAAARLPELEAQIEKLRAVVKAQETAANKE